MANHGTRTRFNQGCTDGHDGAACDPCRLANNEYFKKRGQAKKAEKHNGTITTLSSAASTPITQPRIPGPMEQAILDQHDSLPQADAKPELFQAALVLCRICDNPSNVAQQTQAINQFRLVMADLRKGGGKKSRLAESRNLLNVIPMAEKAN